MVFMEVTMVASKNRNPNMLIITDY